MKDGRWQPHRSCWVVAREIGGPCMDSEDAGQAVAAPPPVLGCCAKSGACDVDARQAVAAPPPMLGPGSLLVRSRGLRGQGGRKTGSGSPTACAGSLLTKSGGPYGHGSPIAHAGSLLAKSGGSR